MYALFLLPVTLFLFPQESRAEELRVSIYSGVQFSTYSVAVSPEMKAVLDAFNPGFKIWDREDFLPSILETYQLQKNQCPQAVFGDFNGDLVGDIILWGHDSKSTLLLAILSYQKESLAFDYKVQVIRKGPPIKNPRELVCSSPAKKGLGSYLTYFPPGQLKSEFEEKPLNLKTAAFKLQDACVSSVALYYYKDGRFHTYTTGD